MGLTIDDARAIAATLPRACEALVRDEVRFRVGRLVYAAFYHDDTSGRPESDDMRLTRR
jgi:hypothetical protein